MVRPNDQAEQVVREEGFVEVNLGAKMETKSRSISFGFGIDGHPTPNGPQRARQASDPSSFNPSDEHPTPMEPNTGFRAKAETTWLIRPNPGKMRM